METVMAASEATMPASGWRLQKLSVGKAFTHSSAQRHGRILNGLAALFWNRFGRFLFHRFEIQPAE
jgi:hypothetical protein